MPPGRQSASESLERSPDRPRRERAAGGGSSPAEVATMLEEYVAPERLPFVICTAEELAVYYGDTPRGEFWAQVRAGFQ